MNDLIEDRDNPALANPSGGEIHWHIIESTDRWFQAHQRSVVSIPTSRSVSVTRWDAQSVAGLIVRLKQSTSNDPATCLIWEYPLGEIAPTRMLDLVATAGELKPRAIQMAHVRPGVQTSTLIALQEVGISIVLHDLWTLRQLMRRIESR